MARTVEQIHQEILDSIASNANLGGLSSVSKFAIYRLFAFIIAYAIFTLELLFDTHKKEIDLAIFNQKSGTPTWYKNKSLAFQYGFDLITDSDQYDNTGLTDEQIEASKIVKYCSVKESLESSRLAIKVANASGDLLVPLTGGQKESFEQYLKEIKYAGVKISVINNPADKLLLTMLVYRNPLVLDDAGNSIINGGKPVEDAVRDYMKALPFDGELVLNYLIEKLRAVDGVDNVHIVSALASAYDSVTSAYQSSVNIFVKTIPVAGYFEIVNFDSVTYVV